MMSESDVVEMQKGWQLLMHSLPINGVATETSATAAVFGDVKAQYCADGRFYHNLAHIKQVLASAQEVAGLAEDWTAVQLAIWFHDVIYKPGAADNEEASARFALKALGGWGVPEKMLQQIEQLIMVTKLGETAVATTAVAGPDALIMQDADLATLGAQPAAYDQYAAAIRQEFAHVPDADYKHGRAHILTYFLQRKQIYQLPHFYQTLESQARQNIQRELALLARSL